MASRLSHYRIEWSPEALDDINAIYNYISADSKLNAGSVVKKIITATDSLEKLPLRSRVVPELEKLKFRECFVYDYRILYRVYEDYILIVAVVHGRRLLDHLARLNEDDIQEPIAVYAA